MAGIDLKAAGRGGSRAQLTTVCSVALVMFLGSNENLKVTTPEDLDIAALLLQRRNGAGPTLIAP